MKEKKFNFVYLTINLINGKKYVGDHSSDNLDSSLTRNYIGSGDLLLDAKKKYGKGNFKREILEFFPTKKEAFNAQEKYIKLYETHVSQNGYNISWKGGNQCNGGMSEKGKANISKAQKGKTGYNLNKKFTEEHKRKIGDANKISLKGRILSEQHRKNISLGNLGKVRTEESKQNMRKPKLKTLNKY